MAPEQRREQLLDAALQATVEEGYAGVSIEAVARAAGVTRPVIYDHFPNLGKLLQAIVAREEGYAVKQVTEALSVPPPADPGQLPATLSAIVRRFLEAVLSRPDTWRLVLLSTDGMPPIVRAHYEANRAAVRVRLQTLIAGDPQRNWFSQELDLELATRAVLGFMEDAGRLVLTDPEGYTPQRFESFVATMLAGIPQSAG